MAGSLLQAQLWVAYCALAVGTTCFLLFLWDAYKTIKSKPDVSAASRNASDFALASSARVTKATVKDLSGLIEALTKLSDSLSKAGPALTSLIGAVLFYVIAAIASGALHSTESNPVPSETPAEQQEQDKPASSDQNGKGNIPPAKKKIPPPE